RGVYRALHSHVAHFAAAATDVVGLRLYAERDNHGAQETYVALGMRDSHYLVFEQRTARPTMSDVKVT
ncbi:MAG: GNAT family N-acetyltransferase, partial [Lysobacterales bacterium]